MSEETETKKVVKQKELSLFEDIFLNYYGCDDNLNKFLLNYFSDFRLPSEEEKEVDYDYDFEQNLIKAVIAYSKNIVKQITDNKMDKFSKEYKNKFKEKDQIVWHDVYSDLSSLFRNKGYSLYLKNKEK